MDGRLLFEDRFDNTWQNQQRIYPLTDAKGNVTTLLTEQASGFKPGARYTYKTFGEWNLSVDLFCDGAVLSDKIMWNYHFAGAYSQGSPGHILRNCAEYYMSGAHYDPFMGQTVPLSELSGDYYKSDLEIDSLTLLDRVLGNVSDFDARLAATVASATAAVTAVFSAPTIANSWAIKTSAKGYMTSQVIISGVETGVEWAFSGDEFSWAGSYGKNLVVNTLTGGIGGKAKGLTKVSMWTLQQTIESAGDAIYDTAVGNYGSFGEAFTTNLFMNSLGDRIFAGVVGAGKMLLPTSKMKAFGLGLVNYLPDANKMKSLMQGMEGIKMPKGRNFPTEMSLLLPLFAKGHKMNASLLNIPGTIIQGSEKWIHSLPPSLGNWIGPAFSFDQIKAGLSEISVSFTEQIVESTYTHYLING